MQLVELLESRRDEILEQAVRSLDRSHLEHYEAAGPERSEESLRRVFDLVLECVRTRRLSPVRQHFEAVAKRRYDGGYGLNEVQTAVNVLEESIWHSVLQDVTPGERAEALALVSTVLGAGKDRLAQRYVELATKRKSPPLDLSGLFKGEIGS